jgi:hypothetical protein
MRDPDDELAELFGWTPADRAAYRDGPDDGPDDEWHGDESWEWPPG